jgi:hypothetical protein
MYYKTISDLIILKNYKEKNLELLISNNFSSLVVFSVEIPLLLNSVKIKR